MSNVILKSIFPVSKTVRTRTGATNTVIGLQGATGATGATGAAGAAGPNTVTTSTTTNLTGYIKGDGTNISGVATIPAADIDSAIARDSELTAAIDALDAAIDAALALKADLVTGKVPSSQLPIAAAGSLGAVRVGNNLSIDGDGILSAEEGMAIGGTVTSATAGRVLYVGAGPVLAESGNLTVDSGALRITPPATSSDIDIIKIDLSNVSNNPRTGVIRVTSDFGIDGLGFRFGNGNTTVLGISGSGASSTAWNINNNEAVYAGTVNLASHGIIQWSDSGFATATGTGGTVIGRYSAGKIYIGNNQSNNPSILLRRNSASFNNREMYRIDATWLTSTDATRKAQIDEYIYDTSERLLHRKYTDGSRGYVTQTVHSTAPADGDLQNSEVAFYTDGSGNLVIKLKDSSGTVRTGTVTLS